MLWDRSQKSVKIIISQDVIFNESDMPYLENEKQQETIREDSLVKVEKVSTHIPITLSEVESDTHQNQWNIDAEGNEDVIEENLVGPLADYRLAKDREQRPCRELQRLSDFTIA
ncbi:Uncharacterized protein Adt_02950 [Abeliophyllum distichum]|uniref:Uncharacterized protein n=1 Tax=Abeliophyllum distichum TaxID=126358 RepID=A0ABD1VXC3_9LAMI